MAQMIPPRAATSTGSSAEIQLFRNIQSTLSKDWTVLHSLVLSEHRAKPWAEIDFVLIGPEGVFCLEVKGGRVARIDGEWHFTNRHDQTTVKSEGPFQQVRTAQAALRAHLLGQMPQISDVAFGHGVAFSHIEWREEGPDMPAEIVFDSRDNEPKFTNYKRRLTSYWHQRLEGITGYEPRQLNERERGEIVALLRGDFDLRPSLSTSLGLAQSELIRLTDEQFGVLQALQENPRVLIRGGAGTGKTLLALEETRRLAEAGKRVFLCCYNKRLGAYLQTAVADFSDVASNVTAGNFDSFIVKAVQNAGLQTRLPDAEAQDLFDIFYPELCLEALEILGSWGQYDAIIVDETQDLMAPAQLDVLEALLKGGLQSGQWRFFYDPFQNLFGRHTPKGLKTIQAAKPARYRLSVNCRNTTPISVATGLLCGQQTESAPASGPAVEWLWFSEVAAQTKTVVSQIALWLSQGIAPHEILVLSPRRRENSCLRNVTHCGAFPLLDKAQSSPHERHIQFATIQSFKGLEAKVVILCDLSDLTNEQTQSSVYVGATRAQALLAVALHESEKAVIVENTKQLAPTMADGAL